MRRILVVSLVLCSASSASAVPAPPQCPWEFQSYVLLHPNGAQATLPLNGSFWIRDYSATPQMFTIVDVAENMKVEATETRTEVTQVGGDLVQLKPNAPLNPDREYEIQIGDPPTSVAWLQKIMTTTSSDTDAPEPPMITQTVANTDPYTVCSVAGVIIYYSLTDPNEALLILAENKADGSLLELSANPSQGQVYSGVVIPTDPNATVDATLVAMDLAGNRSDGVDFNAMAGATPMVTGKIPIDEQPPPDGEDPLGIHQDGGCDCRSAPGDHGADIVWMLFGVLLLRRRFGK